MIEVNASTTKVSGDILQILYPDQIKHLKKESQWSASKFWVALWTLGTFSQYFLVSFLMVTHLFW